MVSEHAGEFDIWANHVVLDPESLAEWPYLIYLWRRGHWKRGATCIKCLDGCNGVSFETSFEASKTQYAKAFQSLKNCLD